MWRGKTKVWHKPLHHLCVPIMWSLTKPLQLHNIQQGLCKPQEHTGNYAYLQIWVSESCKLELFISRWWKMCPYTTDSTGWNDNMTVLANIAMYPAHKRPISDVPVLSMGATLVHVVVHLLVSQPRHLKNPSRQTDWNPLWLVIQSKGVSLFSTHKFSFNFMTVKPDKAWLRK